MNRISDIGIDDDFWSDKTFQEFEKALKGKCYAPDIKEYWDKIPKKPKKKPVKEKDK